MTDRSLIIYAAEYGARDEAMDDYDTLVDLQYRGVVAAFDAAVVYKDDGGEVHIHKHEKPTNDGTWMGAAVGALVGIVYPPALLGSMIVGGVVGGLLGHLTLGRSRHDARQVGEMLDDGQAAIVVIGGPLVSEQLDKVISRVGRSTGPHRQPSALATTGWWCPPNA